MVKTVAELPTRIREAFEIGESVQLVSNATILTLFSY